MGARVAVGKDPVIPTSYDLTPNMPPVGNQGAQNSCVAWAVGYGVQSFYNKLARNTTYTDASGKRDDATVFSPAYIYNQINGGRDEGSQVRSAFDLIQVQGVATLKDMPYRQEGSYFPKQQDYSQQPTEAQKQAAAAYKIKRWSRVNTTVASLKRFLYYDYPVVALIPIDRTFDKPTDKLSNGEFVWKTFDNTNLRTTMGHAVVLVGYDDQLGAFKVQNSWGNDWANKGYLWVSYELLPKILREAYIAIPGEGRSNLKTTQFTTDEVTNIITNRAILGATITDFGDLPIVRYGFALSNQSQTPTGGTAVSLPLTKAPFSFTLSMATSGTAITYVRPFVETMDGGLYYGPTKSFKPIVPPAVNAPVFESGTNSYDIRRTSAKVQNWVKTAVANSIVQHGHVYSKTVFNPTLADSKTELGSGSTAPFSFTSQLANLEGNTTYNVRGYATTTDGNTVYTNQFSFKTSDSDIDPNTLPVVETGDVTNVAATSATVSMQALEKGGGNVRLDNYGVLINTDKTLVEKGQGLKVFLGSVKFDKLTGPALGLAPNTTYYVRAYVDYVISKAGTSTSGQALGTKITTFKTLNDGLSGTWTKVSDATPFKLDDYNKNLVIQSSNFIYIAEPRTGKFFSYKPSDNTYAELAPYATTGVTDFTSGFEGFSLNGSIYLLYSDLTKPTQKLFQSYNPNTRVWTTRAPYPGSPRQQGVSLSIGNKGYYGMGFTSVNGKASMLSDWWEYDATTNVWTRKKDIVPAARWRAASFVVGNKGYVGLGGTYDKTALLPEWWEYSPDTDSWTKKATPPQPASKISDSGGERRAFSLLNGKGYLLVDVGGNDYTTQVYEYDPSTDKWTQKKSFPTGFREPYAVEGFGTLKAFLFGGRDIKNNTYKDIWSFEP